MDDPVSKGDQSRIDILDATRRLFVTQGYHGTSMRAIAREAGDRAVAGLYNHFPNKEAIFEALIEERNPYEDLFAELTSVLAAPTTAQEFVHCALDRLLTILPRHYDFIQLAQIDMREFEGKNMHHVLESTVFPHVMQLFQRLISLPGTKPLDPVVMIRVMASLVIGYMLTERIASRNMFSQYSPDEWADHIANTLLYGITDPDATHGE